MQVSIELGCDVLDDALSMVLTLDTKLLLLGGQEDSQSVMAVAAGSQVTQTAAGPGHDSSVLQV